MHHIGVEAEGFATCYTEDTERVSWLDPFLIHLARLAYYVVPLQSYSLLLT